MAEQRSQAVGAVAGAGSARFRSIEEARAFCRDCFGWYNACHRHSGIGFMTPETVHYGRAQAVHAFRAEMLGPAYAAHPERFVNDAPGPQSSPPPPGSTNLEDNERRWLSKEIDGVSHRG